MKFASLHVSAQNGAVFQTEREGDFVVCTDASSQAIRMGASRRSRGKPVVALHSDVAVFNDDVVVTAKLSTESVYTGGLNLGPQSDVSGLHVVGGTESTVVEVVYDPNVSLSGASDVSVVYPQPGEPLALPEWITSHDEGMTWIFGVDALGRTGEVYLSGHADQSTVAYNASGVASDVGIALDKGAFVTKYDSSGTPIWCVGASQPLADTIDDHNRMHALDQDTGAIYLAVQTQGPVYDASGEASQTVLADGSGIDAAVHIIKWDAMGVAQWAAAIQADSGLIVKSARVDAAGNLYACGTFVAPVSFYDAGRAFQSTLINDGMAAANVPATFIVKYTPGGGFAWATKMEGLSANNLAYDRANDAVVMCGLNWYKSYTTPKTLYAAAGSGGDNLLAHRPILSPEGPTLHGGFVARYTAAGVPAWVSIMHPSSSSVFFSMDGADVDEFGNVYTAGWDTLEVATNGVTCYDAAGNPTGVVITSPNPTLPGSFVIKHSPEGTPVWSTSLRGTLSSGGPYYDCIRVTPRGSVVMGTEMWGIDAVPEVYNSDGSLAATNLPSIWDYYDAKVVFLEFDADGFAMLSGHLDAYIDFVCMDVGSDGHLYLGGFWSGDVMNAWSSDGINFITYPLYGGKYVAKYSLENGETRPYRLLPTPAPQDGKVKYVLNGADTSDVVVELVRENEVLSAVVRPGEGVYLVSHDGKWYI